MRVKGYERTTRDVEIEVDEEDVLNKLRVQAYQAVGLKYDMYLNHKGHLVYDEEHYHGSDTQHTITKTPPENQVRTIQAFDHIRQVLREYRDLELKSSNT
jgi:hypothetical protein